MLKYILLLLLFATTSFCTPTSGNIRNQPVNIKTGNSNTNAENDFAELLTLVNQLRKKGCRCGRKKMRPVAPLKWNNQLATAALAHAKDMKKNKFFQHRGSDKSQVSNRVEKAGYEWQAVAENIFWGDAELQEVFQAWKDSPSHCKNLMSGEYAEMGAARAGIYWVQDFGKQF